FIALVPQTHGGRGYGLTAECVSTPFQPSAALLNKRRLSIGSDALDHGIEPVRTLGCQVVREPELTEDGARVGAEHLLRRAAGVEREQDGDEAADDVGIAVALHVQYRRAAGARGPVGCQPDLTDTAAHLVLRRALGLIERGE